MLVLRGGVVPGAYFPPEGVRLGFTRGRGGPVEDSGGEPVPGLDGFENAPRHSWGTFWWGVECLKAPLRTSSVMGSARAMDAQPARGDRCASAALRENIGRCIPVRSSAIGTGGGGGLGAVDGGAREEGWRVGGLGGNNPAPCQRC